MLEQDKKLAEEVIQMITKESSIGTKSIAEMLEKKVDDQDQRKRVMKRVKLLLDPNGSRIGRDLPPEAYDAMTEEQKQQYEHEKMMKGMANKCIWKCVEAAVMTVCMLGLLHFTGQANNVFSQISSHLVVPERTMSSEQQFAATASDAIAGSPDL